MAENTETAPDTGPQVSEESLPPKPGMDTDGTAPEVVDLPLPSKPKPSGPMMPPMPSFSGGPEAHMQQMFMNPLFNEMQDRIKESEKILDKMSLQYEKEREERIREKQQAYIPEKLRGKGQNLGEVMRRVEDMIVYGAEQCIEAEKKEQEALDKEKNKGIMDIWLESRQTDRPEMHEDPNVETAPEDTRKPVDIRKLDDHGHAAITAHSMAAYVSCLPRAQFDSFSQKIQGDCELWLTKMFRFNDASVNYHDQPDEGLVRVCRLAMFQKYPKYITEGFEALYSRPPVIYLSSAARHGLGEYICQQLGLPLSSIVSVPCESTLGSASKMDTVILSKLIEDDIAAAKTPIAVLAYAGTPNMGHVDNIETIQEICKKHNIWLHIEGDNLALMALIHPPDDVCQAKLGDSFTVCMGRWLGIPAIPFATLYKASDPVLVKAASLTSHNNPAQKLSCLPLWVTLQSLGIETIGTRLKETCELADYFITELFKVKNICQFSQDAKKVKDKAIRSITDLISQAITALLMFESVSTTVVFRYMEDKSESQIIAVAPYAMGSEEDESVIQEAKQKQQYYNTLNVWLAETLQAENPNVEITLVELEQEGVCMRFSPLESAHAMGTTKDHLEDFVKCLRTQLSILDATVLNYEKFRIVTGEHENLRVVELKDWAGLGAVQYIPTEYLDCVDNLTEMAHKEINNLNVELVHKLKSTDSAFSMGVTESNLCCVKFGLITEDTDIMELISLVQNTGKEVEESSKYQETMSELIRKGIEEANKDLQLENQHKLQQEGVLRQIPMIGSMMNWWSPPPKDVMKGRTFNLVSGTIASTEETYKYKMQLQKEAAGGSPRQRQTSVSSTTSARSDTSAKTNGTTPESPRSAAPPSPRPATSGPGTMPASAGPGTKQAMSGAGVNAVTKTAGDVKAGIVNGISEGELADTQETASGVNGNLRLDLETPQTS